MIQSKINRSLILLASLLSLVAALPAQAVPSFARQTGEDCAACHTSFPELTPFGRNFKLNGYTLGERQMLPLAAMMQFSMTHIDKQTSDGNKYMMRQNDPQFDGASLFLAGKISDNVGGFIQWTYENLDHLRNDGTTIAHHSHVDNTDLRLVGTYDLFGRDTVVGLVLNNNPTVQDVWNSTPAWGFPFNGSKLPDVGGPGGSPLPSAGTQIDGGLAQTVEGLGGYFWWDRHLYGELSFYGTADGFWRPLSKGAWYKSTGPTLAGRDNPYWRLAWSQDWGAHSLMVGTYGMRVDMYPDPTVTSGPTNRFTDTALDAQYQYISDPHIITAQATYIHEKQEYAVGAFDPSCAAAGSGTPCNSSDTLNTFRAKLSYLYDRKYGATLAYFQTLGRADLGLYNGASAKPDTRGYILEADYNPWTNVRFALQYTGYTKINGGNNGYDPASPSRKASDNNTLFLNTWFAF